MNKVTYPPDYNPILEYWDAIESGRETVCSKIYRCTSILRGWQPIPGSISILPKGQTTFWNLRRITAGSQKGPEPENRCAWSCGRRPTWHPYLDLSI